MKIVVIGNTNNYPHLLARALVELGNDVHHVLDHDAILHLPEGKFQNVSADYSGGVKLLRLGRVDFSNLSWIRKRDSAVAELIRSADLVIFNGLSPAILGLKSDRSIFVLTGADLTFIRDWYRLGKADQYSVPWTTRLDSRRKYLGRAWLCQMRQKRLIRSASIYSFFSPGSVPEGDRVLHQLKPRGERFVLRLADQSEATFVRSKGVNDVLHLLCLGRVSWARRSPDTRISLDFKGTDLLLRGVASARDLGHENFKVTLFRKGPDIAETLVLIDDLGIGEFIFWHDEVPQRQLVKMILECDVVVDNLGPGSPGMATLDSMALGRAVLTNTGTIVSDLDPLKGAPLLHASSVEHVCGWIEKLASDPSLVSRYGDAGRLFATERLSVGRQAEGLLKVLKGES